MSACPDLPPCSPGSKADSVLSPDPAPGSVPTLSSKSGGYPRLHLAPGFCLQSSQIFGIHHPVMPPPGGSAHKTKQAQGQMGWGLSLGGVSHTWPQLTSLHLGLPGRVLLANHSGGCPHAWLPPKSWPGVTTSTFMPAGGWDHVTSFVTWHGREGLWGTVRRRRRRRGYLQSILLVPEPG